MLTLYTQRETEVFSCGHDVIRKKARVFRTKRP